MTRRESGRWFTLIIQQQPNLIQRPWLPYTEVASKIWEIHLACTTWKSSDSDLRGISQADCFPPRPEKQKKSFLPRVGQKGTTGLSRICFLKLLMASISLSQLLSIRRRESALWLQGQGLVDPAPSWCAWLIEELKKLLHPDTALTFSIMAKSAMRWALFSLLSYCGPIDRPTITFHVDGVQALAGFNRSLPTNGWI